MLSSTKRPGNILSAFASDYKADLGDKFVKLKEKLLTELGGPENLNNAWNRLIKEFEEETKTIEEKGSNIIPQIDFQTLEENGGQFPPEIAEEIRKRGCALIRHVVKEEEALKYKRDVKNYIQNHPGEIVGFPEDKPQVWELYWSKSQVAARSHPNFLMATKAMNGLWHAEPGTPIDLSVNVAYCDRLRIREKGDTSFTLSEHIDGGSVERWEDPEYRKCFSKILEGKWEEHDAFDATHRVTANMDLYDCSGGCSMFRSFQGWLSLSHVKTGEGTLRVCPLIKLSTSYVILRPFLKDLLNSNEMAGAIPGAQQQIRPDLHPHIISAMVSIPEVGPGDCMFWHCDQIHAVEGVCKAPEDSSVLYIPATPLCTKNADYVLKERHAFLNGLTPHDFPLNNCEKEFEDRAKEADLTEEGKLVMGFKRFVPSKNEIGNNEDGARKAVEYANQILFS